MNLSQCEWFLKPHILSFNFDARTSRGKMASHKTYIIKLVDKKQSIIAYGEISPLKGLSIDFSEDMIPLINQTIKDFKNFEIPNSQEELFEAIANLIPKQYPSLRFGFETLLLDFKNGGKQVIFDNDFHKGLKEIPINGLIWIDSVARMEEQIKTKIKNGFKCIKLKIGANDPFDELELLKKIRNRYPVSDITLRVDANGAFSKNLSEKVIKSLNDLEIHSIEQPIKPGNFQDMKSLTNQCQSMQIGIALDEELIVLDSVEEKITAIESTNPQFLVLKPQLLGGYASTRQIIEYADQNDIPWWITSALESNIGLNGITQFTANFETSLPQGLGTGSLYFNNFSSPLSINNGKIAHNQDKEWSFVAKSLEN